MRRLATAALLAVLTLGLAGCGESDTRGGAPPPATAGGPGAGFPTPREETFAGCPPTGDGGDSALNALKNRIDTGAWQTVALGDLLALTWPVSVEREPRATWSGQDAALVAAHEGMPVRVEGALLRVRHQGRESTNCHDPDQRDFHLWLATSPDDTRARSMVVEVTPRVRALHPGWSPDARLLDLSGRRVRISGWLMLDQDHPEQVRRTRATLWEVHPVLTIEVEEGGRWVDLDGAALPSS